MTPLPSAKPAALTDLLMTGVFRSNAKYSTHRPRGTGDYLLILTTGGSGEFSSGGRTFMAEPGDLTLYRPAAPQDYRTAPGQKQWSLLWVHFLPRVHWLPWLAWPEVLPGLHHLRLADRTAARVKEELTAMHKWSTNAREPRGRELAMTSLERALLIAAPRAGRDGKAGKPMDERIIQTIEILSSQGPKAGVDLDRLARETGLSLSRLQHLFRQQTGKTLLAFAEDRRLDLAKRLLAGTGLSVKEIADQCGYASPFYFSLRFKAAMGKSPLHWREAR